MSNAWRYCIDGDSWTLTTMDNLRTSSGFTTHIPSEKRYNITRENSVDLNDSPRLFVHVSKLIQ